MDPSAPSTVVCDHCGHELEAVDAVHRAVATHGCVVCGTVSEHGIGGA
jgi:hypothetical protein